ncbi:MAG: hypothetical protein RBG13Loki_1461 [Promethearchaeota archaeon CR_4]|nr:MAG: hypothetical protein RBG13Loki_1461 [Candidatus Lokiarchaeota archaeon CR_4]
MILVISCTIRSGSYPTQSYSVLLDLYTPFLLRSGDLYAITGDIPPNGLPECSKKGACFEDLISLYGKVPFQRS